MQLAILLVVVCAVSGAGSDAGLVDGAPWRLPAALLLLAGAPLAAVMARMSLSGKLRSGRIDSRQSQQQLESWQALIAWLWVGSCLAVLYLGRWPSIVRSLPVTLAWPLVDELLILAPLLASLLLVWIACFYLDRALQSFAAPANAEPCVSLRRYVELRVRHHLGLILLPALVILGVQETAVKLELISGADDERSWWLWAALMAAAVLGLPLALRWLWQAQRVADSPLKQRLLASCRRLGCGVRDIVVWRTGGTVANAAVTGLFPSLRTIFLSDALIARLTDDEIDVVVRHEAAHLARRHLWQRLAFLGLPVLVYFAAQAQWPQALDGLRACFTGIGISPFWQLTLLMPLAAMAYALAMMGWLARLHEHDADLAACSAVLSGETVIDEGAVAHLHSALAKVVGESDEYRRGRWLHPSVIERVEFLHRLGDEPLLAPRFRSRLLGLSCFLLAACAAALTVGVWPS